MSRYHLEMYMEQGSEGAHWLIYDTTKTGYEGLVSLEDGMKINIPGKWKGSIKKDYESNRKWYRKCEPYVQTEDYRGMLAAWGFDTIEISNEECKLTAWQHLTQQVANGYRCHWVQEGLDPDEWGRWFEDELPVEIL